ncbi:hypothetical protein ACFSQ3_14545 [Sphingobacterium corticis]|uniref:Lasso RiPP family leader peptide-containing protein n=1 Tax=Sphingobacterium corticis TaxID=1812823 RepID=A0ABW5NM75_9SPHI
MFEKKTYSSPIIEVFYVETEMCIAAASDVTFSGAGGTQGQPDVEEAVLEDSNSDIFF